PRGNSHSALAFRDTSFSKILVMGDRRAVRCAHAPSRNALNTSLQAPRAPSVARTVLEGACAHHTSKRLRGPCAGKRVALRRPLVVPADLSAIATVASKFRDRRAAKRASPARERISMRGMESALKALEKLQAADRHRAPLEGSSHH